jgi:DICT domain-containing protein
MASTFTAEAYRSEAQRLRDVADTAASEAIRAELLDLAQHYEELADLAEADNRGD